MNLKFITFNHLKILANNLKNYLNKYNETIKSQKINNITASTAITTLEGYNITIPTVEIQDYSDVENRKYSQLNSVVVRKYPAFKTIDTTEIPNINTIDTTDVPDIKTTGIPNRVPGDQQEVDFREISIRDVYEVQDINLRYVVSKKVGVVVARSYKKNGSWITNYSKYIIVNGELVYSNSATLNQEYSNAQACGEYLLTPDSYSYNNRWCFLNHNGTLSYW